MTGIVGGPDFVQYAQAYGAKGWRLEQTADLEPLLGRCLEESGVHIIDVPVDYSLNDETLHKVIPELSAAI